MSHINKTVTSPRCKA